MMRLLVMLSTLLLISDICYAAGGRPTRVECMPVWKQRAISETAVAQRFIRPAMKQKHKIMLIDLKDADGQKLTIPMNYDSCDMADGKICAGFAGRVCN
jgi:hypothetical protein